MTTKPDYAALVAGANSGDQFTKQILRVRNLKQQTDCIEAAVQDVSTNLPKATSGALVVYGDPQSGKTEMMICLTAQLLDQGTKVIVHLLNDSVDLLMQSLDRFKLAGLAPAPRNAADLTNAPLVPGNTAILFCKKNAKDLGRLIKALVQAGPIAVIDDEADYATPNGKVNIREKTKINALVSTLLGDKGRYIGVTATPARLNLNNTFDNKTETWVRFRPHAAYTGQDVFFPQNGPVSYRLTQLSGAGTADDTRKALSRFLATVAFLNLQATKSQQPEKNYSFLIHTSGKTDDHKIDRKVVEDAMAALVSRKGPKFEAILSLVYQQTLALYGKSEVDAISSYVIANASRSAFVVLNSKRDRASAGDKPTEPTCPFTVIIGGNIVSRGVTFPNLLSMYFTRDVKSKLQQDTYIQRARMFGSRNSYLKYFELTIPAILYADWHRCFVFHRLALEAMKNNKVPPVWIGDSRISIAATSSIDRGTVDLDKGEMSFEMFSCNDVPKLDAIVKKDPSSLGTLKELAKEIGAGLPEYLIEYVDAALKRSPNSLAIHTASSIEKYTSADLEKISRVKGFLGKPQLEVSRFPAAIHHVKILHNGRGKARLFYKSKGGVQFVQNMTA